MVWTALGWKGSVLLRLRTGAYGTIERGPCVGCGRTIPRLVLTAESSHVASVLAGHSGVAAWQAELRTVDGREELLVFLTPAPDGHPGPLVRELDAQLSATQYVVLSRSALDARLDEHGGRQVVDLRG